MITEKEARRREREAFEECYKFLFGNDPPVRMPIVVAEALKRYPDPAPLYICPNAKKCGEECIHPGHATPHQQSGSCANTCPNGPHCCPIGCQPIEEPKAPECPEELQSTDAEAHVDWWLSSVRQLLIDNYRHGYKHGFADGRRKA